MGASLGGDATFAKLWLDLDFLFSRFVETIKSDIESSHIFGSNVYANAFLRIR